MMFIIGDYLHEYDTLSNEEQKNGDEQHAVHQAVHPSQRIV